MFDWEEKLFVGLKALHRGIFIRPAQKQKEATRVTLHEKRGELIFLARMLSGQDPGIFETRDSVLHRGGRIFLPSEFSIASTREANASLYELKTILAALAIRTGWLPGRQITKLVNVCSEEYPNLPDRIRRLSSFLPATVSLPALFGLPFDRIEDLANKSLPWAYDGMPDATTVEAVTEINGEGRDNVSITLSNEDDGPGSEMPIHTFEKIETLEEYGGHSRKTDDDDELDEHEEALSALRMTTLMRTPERPRSIYRSDLILDGLNLEIADRGKSPGIPYPEWDYGRREHRKDWCFVQEVRQTTPDRNWSTRVAARHHALIHRLKRQFAQMLTERERMLRQPLGREFDMDSVVDAQVRLRTGSTPSENVYMDTRRAPHDLAAMILLDESFSTDSYLNDRRILDLITETVYCVGEVLEESIAHLGVAAFSSNTRRACRFSMIKDFKEPWSTGRDRLGTLQPNGYTRIGPALRHAQECLASVRASRRLVILVTDGRPCDYDRYEGTYGIHDVRKAVETGRQHDIHTHAFAVEKRAAEFFPQMLRPRQFDIVPDPSRLASTMCALFQRILK